MTLGPSPLCCYTCLKDNICIRCGSIRYTNTNYIIMEDVSTHRTKIYLNHCSCVFSCHLGTPSATLKIFHWGILLHVGHFFPLQARHPTYNQRKRRILTRNTFLCSCTLTISPSRLCCNFLFKFLNSIQQYFFPCHCWTLLCPASTTIIKLCSQFLHLN